MLRSALQFLSSAGSSKYGLFWKFPFHPSSFYSNCKAELSSELPQGRRWELHESGKSSCLLSLTCSLCFGRQASMVVSLRAGSAPVIQSMVES